MRRIGQIQRIRQNSSLLRIRKDHPLRIRQINYITQTTPLSDTYTDLTIQNVYDKRTLYKLRTF